MGASVGKYNFELTIKYPWVGHGLQLLQLKRQRANGAKSNFVHAELAQFWGSEIGHLDVWWRGSYWYIGVGRDKQLALMEGKRPRPQLSLPQLSLLNEDGQEQEIFEDEDFLGRSPPVCRSGFWDLFFFSGLFHLLPGINCRPGRNTTRHKKIVASLGQHDFYYKPVFKLYRYLCNF